MPYFTLGDECLTIPITQYGTASLTTETGIAVSADYDSLSQLTAWHNSLLTISCFAGYSFPGSDTETVVRCNETQMWDLEPYNCTGGVLAMLAILCNFLFVVVVLVQPFSFPALTKSIPYFCLYF